jgi:hypothetical protein
MLLVRSSLLHRPDKLWPAVQNRRQTGWTFLLRAQQVVDCQTVRHLNAEFADDSRVGDSSSLLDAVVVG